jgi:Flp pilus assembly protein TadD
MSKSRRRPEKKIQPSQVGARKSVISEGGKKSLERPASEVRLLCVLLTVVCVLVIVVHWPALSAGALSFDDSQYLTENVLVQTPSWSSARRFLTEVLEPSTVKGYYQPLAMISLMLDYALGGRGNNLRPFHRTSLGLHVANTALVSVLLYLLFGRAVVAAGVGLLFGVHPMTVETIAWVGERKTLLAAFFALWSLVLYVLYTRKSNRRFYICCIFMYILALMSKPTSTPLPLLMLLMDYWPLRRWRWSVVVEKVPFFVAGGVSAIITFVSQSWTYATELPSEYGAGRIPLVLCHNIIFYLYKIFRPVNLSSHYAFPEPLTLFEPMVLAGVIGTCILIVLLVISLRWTRAVATGWLFFFVGILPTMQIIGFSDVIASDKFAYLPSAGLLMVLTSFFVWLTAVGKIRRCAAVVAAILIIAGAESAATRRYLVHWRDTVSLTKYMLTFTPNVAPMHNHLGIALASEGKIDEAIRHYREALRIRPGYAKAHNNLGSVLAKEGKLDEAISHFHHALQAKPDLPEVYINLGSLFKTQGKFDEAISHFRQALQIKPDSADAHNQLGSLIGSQGRFDEAIGHFREALRAKPNYAEALNNLGSALAAKGKFDEAIGYFRQAVQIKADFAEAHNNLRMALRLRDKPD